MFHDEPDNRKIIEPPGEASAQNGAIPGDKPVTWPQIDDGVLVDMPGQLGKIAFADALRKHPGRMALLVRQPAARRRTVATWAHHIRRGTKQMSMFQPPGHFEASVNKIFEETHLHVRYVGPEITKEPDRPLLGLAAALERVRLVQAWYGRALYYERSPARIRQLKASRQECVDEARRLGFADPETVDRIGREYGERFKQLTEEHGIT